MIAKGHHRFTIDPTVSNVAAIKSYASVGFRPVGILRQSERDHSPQAPREFRDALLMDLLASELIEG
jgi:aminoglycoside 6'-N-acetyltransferase